MTDNPLVENPLIGCRAVGHAWDRPHDRENNKPGTYTCDICATTLRIDTAGGLHFTYPSGYVDRRPSIIGHDDAPRLQQ